MLLLSFTEINSYVCYFTTIFEKFQGEDLAAIDKNRDKKHGIIAIY